MQTVRVSIQLQIRNLFEVHHRLRYVGVNGSVVSDTSKREYFSSIADAATALESCLENLEMADDEIEEATFMFHQIQNPLRDAVRDILIDCDEEFWTEVNEATEGQRVSLDVCVEDIRALKAALEAAQ